MKHLMVFLLVAILSSCFGQSQSINREIANEGEKPYLLGKIDKQGLTSSNYNLWFSTQYDDYKINNEIVKKVSEKLKAHEILVFMGTWCGDSRREVPRFYKILEASNYPMNKLTTVAVSSKPGMYKQSPGHEELGLNIHRVPTFIFYKNGKEVNRIVESPVFSLEADIEAILGGEYTPNYTVVAKLAKLLDDRNFYGNIKKRIPEFKNEVKNMYELNTYARLLSSTKRTDKALEILKLNAKLFPEKVQVYINLGSHLYQADNKKEALSNYEKALQMNPDNPKLKSKVEQLKNEI